VSSSPPWPEPREELFVHTPLSSHLDGLDRLPEEDIEAEVLLQKAESACRRDARVTKLIGYDIIVDKLISSADDMVDGERAIQLQFSLSRGGVGSLIGRWHDGHLQLTSLKVRVAGRQSIDVPVRAGGATGDEGTGTRTWGMGSDVSDDGVIDVDAYSSGDDSEDDDEGSERAARALLGEEATEAATPPSPPIMSKKKNTKKNAVVLQSIDEDEEDDEQPTPATVTAL